MERVIDCIIDQKVDGVCILANFSEQFLIDDEEREKLTRLCLEKIDGRIKSIVTISHFSTKIVLDRAKLAKSLGADIVMMMPPYHGALLKGNADQTFNQFNEVSKIGIKIMIQDAPLSGVELSVPLLTKMINEITNSNPDIFLDRELEIRKKNKLPPYERFIALILTGDNEQKLEKDAYYFKTFLKDKIDAKVLGPVNAPIFRLKRKFRFRLLIRGSKSLKLQNSISELILKFKFSRGIKLTVDVDPINFN